MRNQYRAFQRIPGPLPRRTSDTPGLKSTARRREAGATPAGRQSEALISNFRSRARSIRTGSEQDGSKGSILRVRIFLPERSVLAGLSLSAFDRNPAHWSQLGVASVFSTGFESWGSIQRGGDIRSIWSWIRLGERVESALVARRRNRRSLRLELVSRPKNDLGLPLVEPH
jgi:hypothetical protein